MNIVFLLDEKTNKQIVEYMRFKIGSQDGPYFTLIRGFKS
jgi:hypothetical protein